MYIHLLIIIYIFIKFIVDDLFTAHVCRLISPNFSFSRKFENPFYTAGVSMLIFITTHY